MEAEVGLHGGLGAEALGSFDWQTYKKIISGEVIHIFGIWGGGPQEGVTFFIRFQRILKGKAGTMKLSISWKMEKEIIYSQTYEWSTHTISWSMHHCAQQVALKHVSYATWNSFVVLAMSLTYRLQLICLILKA